MIFFITVGGVQLWFFHVKIIVSLSLDCLIGIVIFCLKLLHNHKSISRGFLDFSIGIRAGRSIFFKKILLDRFIIIIFLKISFRTRSCLICDNGFKEVG